MTSDAGAILQRFMLGSKLAFIILSSQYLLSAQSWAEDRQIPVARMTIYPGDRLYDGLLEERRFSYEAVPEGVAVKSKAQIIGKVAKRTLLPGRPISPIAVDNPKIVVIGAQVKIVFTEAGLEISAYGMAMQAGAVGDLIRVRNLDSGLMVSGRVLFDGSVRVSEG